MNAEALANYLLNNDYELQVWNEEFDLIAEMLDADGVIVNTETIKEAVALAKEDSLLQQIARDLNL